MLAAPPSDADADSLFRAGRYLAAYRIYNDLQSQPSQPEHLLRMAYIQEGLQQYPKALYHLTSYYLQYQDPRVWEKIATLSKVHRISGYELTEEEQLLLWILAHKGWLFVGSGLVWLLFVLKALTSSRSRVWPAVGLVLSSVCLLLLLERQLWLPKRAVVLADVALLHLGPSAAAPLRRASLTPGTLLQVKEQGPVWTKVEWNGRASYLRTQQIGLLRYD